MPESGFRLLIFRFIAVLFGLCLVVLSLEIFLRSAGGIVGLSRNQQHPGFGKSDKLILFSGDSWTAGSDAEQGKGFFYLLEADDDFKDFSFVNLGYGSNTSLQVVNNIVNYKEIPKIVVANMGINCWHLMGVEEFGDIAENYFSPDEMARMANELKLPYDWAWARNLKVYKFLKYFISSRQNKKYIDQKIMEEKLATPSFWDVLIKFREKHPSFEEQYEALPALLKEKKDWSLDQKFYFVTLNIGWASNESEAVLKKAGLFFPEKLSVFPYDFYEKNNITKSGISDARVSFLKWSFKLLDEWAKRNEVVVFIQTYPDIKKEKLGINSFDHVNGLIKAFARLHKFKIIDHNAQGIDWRRYRTPWHVNTEGHLLMKNTIKNELLRFLKDSKEELSIKRTAGEE